MYKLIFQVLSVEYHRLSDIQRRKLLNFMETVGFENRMNISAKEGTIDDYIFIQKGFKTEVKLDNVYIEVGPYMNGTFPGKHPGTDM